MKKRPLVSIIMGSDSDLEVMEEASKILEEFSVPYEISILSAHRSPNETAEFAKTAKLKGVQVIIAGAGGAAHLAGVVASLTTLPVIGVPMESGSLKGLDSLFSIVQMPGGIPVATMAIGKAGAKNAGILAAQILALSNQILENKLESYKKSLADSVKEKNRSLKERNK